MNSLINVKLQTVKGVLASFEIDGDIGLHYMKNLLSYKLLPYEPSIFKSSISGTVVSWSGANSASPQYLKTKYSLNEHHVKVEISSESIN